MFLQSVNINTQTEKEVSSKFNVRSIQDESLFNLKDLIP